MGGTNLQVRYECDACISILAIRPSLGERLAGSMEHGHVTVVSGGVIMVL
jgi:hypothetical protein